MKDYLIIGQGICGTLLSYYLKEAGKSFLVIDNAKPNSASRVASGVINPVTGRQIVTTWMADELLPYTQNAYKEIQVALGIKVVSETDVVSFPLTTQMVLAYEKALEKGHAYLKLVDDETAYQSLFDYVFKPTNINPAYLIDVQTLLQKWQQVLVGDNALIQTHFDYEKLTMHDDFIEYENIKASKIIFCNGTNSFNYPLWDKLPFSFNKGEALIVDIPALDNSKIYKFGLITFVPWQDGLWWVGSTYDRDYKDELPTQIFKEKTTELLKAILKTPFTIVDHIAALRPANMERKPFVGLHPNYPNSGILNGMGTKGCSLAPLFAKQLVNHLLHGEPILPDADVQRFRKVMNR